MFTFTWSPVAPDCPTVYYNILASNCGSCPTTTNHTTVTCTDVPTNGSTCTFAVQTVVCGNVFGNSSDSINITSANTKEKTVNIRVNATTYTKDRQDNHNVTLQQNVCASTTSSVSKNSETTGVTFISTILLSTLFITWIAISTVIIVILLKFKIKVKHELEMANQELITSTNSSCNTVSQTAIDTSENVAYGMFSRARNHL